MLCLSPSTRNLEFIHRVLTKHQLCIKHLPPCPWVYNLIINHIPFKVWVTKDPKEQTHTKGQWEFKKGIFLFLAVRWKRFPGKVFSEFGVSVEYRTPRSRNYRMAQDKHWGGKTKEKLPFLAPSFPLKCFFPVLHSPSPPSVLSPCRNPYPVYPAINECLRWLQVQMQPGKGALIQLVQNEEGPEVPPELYLFYIMTGHLKALPPFKNVTCDKRMT